MTQAEAGFVVAVLTRRQLMSPSGGRLVRVQDDGVRTFMTGDSTSTLEDSETLLDLPSHFASSSRITMLFPTCPPPSLGDPHLPFSTFSDASSMGPRRYMLVLLAGRSLLMISVLAGRETGVGVARVTHMGGG